jgi:hypothetical protein
MDMIEEIDTRVRMVRIVEKLPYPMQTRWRKIAITSKREKGSYPDIRKFVDFVEECVDEVADPVFGVKQKSGNQQDRKPKSTSLQTNADKTGSTGKPRKQVPCPKCEGGHPLFLCNKFKAMSPEERLKLVREKECCLNCLKPGHKAEDCRNPRVCNSGECKEKHSFLLHDALVAKNSDGNKANLSTSLNSNEGPPRKVCLPCVEVVVSNGNNRFVTKALIDTGSDRSYCKKSLVQCLQLKGVDKITYMQTMHGIKASEVEVVDFDVCDLTSHFKVRLRDVYATAQFPRLESSVATRQDIEAWPHLKDLPIGNCEDVSILIGQNQPEAMEIKEVKYGKEGQPYAIRYSLGWTVSGPVSSNPANQIVGCELVTSNFAIGDEQLHDQVSRFFELDHVPNRNPDCHSVNDKKVIELWEDTTEVIDGRYSLQLPFKETPPNLPDNRQTAEKRLESLERNLQRDEIKQKRYAEEIQKLLDNDYAEKVDEKKCPSGLTWYLPHHSVFNVKKPDKLAAVSTEVRH